MDLSTLNDSLRRAVAPLGEFATFFPNTTDADLIGTLADAVAEAQLDGFLSGDALDTSLNTVTPALSTAEQALVVLYARARVLAAGLANLKTRTRYKAGPVEAETEQAASVLVALLRDTSERKKQILDDAKYSGTGLGFAMVDLYVSKSLDANSADVGYLFDGTLY